MKDKTPKFLRGRPDYYSELISQNTRNENEKIYDALVKIENYLNSSLVNPVYSLNLEDIVRDKEISNFLKHEVSFVKPSNHLLLEPESDETTYLLSFKKQLEQKLPEVSLRNAKFLMKLNGDVEYHASSGKTYLKQFRQDTSSYKLLRYLIEEGTTSVPTPYLKLGKAVSSESDRTGIIRNISDTVTYIRKRLGIKANSSDDLFVAGNGIAMRVAASFV